MPVIFSLTGPQADANPITWDYVDIALDPDTLDISDDIAMVRGDQAVLQRILQRLRFFLGEWFLDVRQGVPWFQQIFGTRNPELGRVVLQKVIADTSGVDSVNMVILEFDRATRTLSLSFTAKLRTGTILTATALPMIYTPVAA